MLIRACVTLQDLLYKLYHYNHQSSTWDIRPHVPAAAAQPPATQPEFCAAVRDTYLESQTQLHNWGGGRARRLLQAIYTIAHLCLLRPDEVLKIQVHNITVYENNSVTILLPFRKSHQNGGGFIRLSSCV
jgi:hypothetical protein